MKLRIESGHLRGKVVSGWDKLLDLIEAGCDMRLGMSMWVSFCLSRRRVQFYIRHRIYKFPLLEVGHKALVFSNIGLTHEIQGKGHFRKMMQEEIFPLCERRRLMFVIESAQRSVLCPKLTQEGSIWYGFTQKAMDPAYVEKLESKGVCIDTYMPVAHFYKIF